MTSPETTTAHAQLHARASGDDAVARATDRLRAGGTRITAPRSGVLRVLAEQHEHLRADQVADLLSGAGVHRATVYRTLELLAATGVVASRSLPGGATGYHLDVQGDGHGHLHASCRSCGQVVAVPEHALDAAVDTVRRAVGFRVDTRRSELVGVCSGCAEPGPEGSGSAQP